jgi:serine/threonine protein kinase
MQVAYKGNEADLFASAVILYIMMTTGVPFSKADPSDPNYRLFMGNPGRFWAVRSRGRLQGVFSEEFRDLMGKMLSLHPQSRLSIAQIRVHPWFNEDAMTKEELVNELTGRRYKMMEDAMNKQMLAAAIA